MIDKNIVVLHGWGAHRQRLAPLVSELRNKRWNVFFPKLPGFGGGELTRAYNLEDYVLQVVNESAKRFAGKKYFVFGHSFGGRIAIKLSLSDQNLSGLILCASGGISRGKFIKRAVFYMLAKTGRVFLFHKPLADRFRKILYKAAREHDYEKTSGYVKETFKNVASEDLRKLAKTIKTPTLILWGKNDKMTPYKDALYLNRSIKDSELVSYTNDGHTLPYVEPEEISKKIEIWYQNLS
ncbi:MAG: Hydrolase, alpha/beta fold family protein [Candidatus Woesebacteria bacterium GW2011_GWA1_39_21]|uniref:Hydrolase, alpha/beta fold family protein n=1 Tax=Candidatus Woesebacteria bacterium GW2011_GWA1_39_21 TaxID=1618550 RepID=A0A0G0N8K8_9BACT|nr:MAG: Hydrolase, alpha/beta fold family protein [Candidatus Woesebacteria bacterium GW2011_GWA1_39_21]